MTEDRWLREGREDTERKKGDGGRLSYRLGVRVDFGYSAQKASG